MVYAAMVQAGSSRIRYKQQQQEQEEVGARKGRMVVHVGSMPLRAPPGPARWALCSADRLLSIHHFYTILQPIPASASPQRLCMVFDFQPQNPEDLYTAIVGLSGGAVPEESMCRDRASSSKMWKGQSIVISGNVELDTAMCGIDKNVKQIASWSQLFDQKPRRKGVNKIQRKICRERERQRVKGS